MMDEFRRIKKAMPSQDTLTDKLLRVSIKIMGYVSDLRYKTVPQLKLLSELQVEDRENTDSGMQNFERIVYFELRQVVL